MGFAADTLAQVERANERLDTIIGQSILELGERLITVSAEKTGRFKSNWYYGSGSPAFVTNEQTDVRTLNNLDALPANAAGGMHYVSNSLPYALRLEYGFSGADSLGRIYNQPPRPMLGLVTLEWPQIVDLVARRVAG